MKILELTLEAPSDYSGGGIGIKQSILSLVEIGEVDYVGPKIEKTYIDSEKFNVLYELEHNENVVNRFLLFLRGIVNGYYKSWKKIERRINWEDYDYIHIEFSKYPFLLKMCKKTKKSFILRVHNVEADYYINIFRSQKNIKNFFQYIIYRQAEKKCIKSARNIVTLTVEDKKRIMELYGYGTSRIYVNPVCVEEKREYIEKKNNRILMTGSLWYGPNLDGIRWFIENVWEEIREVCDDVTLVIAGGKPAKDFESECIHNGIELIKDPDDISPYFKDSSFYVAPIFSGAGMKVKVAEALSYGMPIIASEHALIGYDYENMSSVKMCRSAEEFRREIIWMNSLSELEYKKLCMESKEKFQKKYSILSSVDFYKKITKKI